MAPQGYADGLLKPANQVRQQKNLVKGVPGSNIPQPAKSKRVKQSVQQQMEEARVKAAQQAYLPPGGSVGPVREIQAMNGLSGMQRSIDMDKHMKTREQIMISKPSRFRRPSRRKSVLTQSKDCRSS